MGSNLTIQPFEQHTQAYAAMAVPGLPVPSAIQQRSQLTHRRRASKSLQALVSNTSPSTKKRLAWFLILLLVFLLGSRYGSHKNPRYDPRSPTTSSAFVVPSTPPFYVAPHLLPPPQSPPTGFAVTPERRIPPILHYVFGMTKDFGNKPFGFIQFVAMNSALENIRPQKIMFWYLFLPSGWWFTKIQEFAAKKGVVFELKRAREVNEIFGNKIDHFAHKADIIRLEALKMYGGIYLDSDVFVVKDFAPLYQFSTVMGTEAQPDQTQDAPVGLCNAVILSQPYSPFISRWLDSYADFDRSLWATHSVARPWELAKQHPHEITVLNKYAFFWPLWHDDHMQLVYRSLGWDFDKSGQFAYHGWEALAWSSLAQLDPDTIWIYGSKSDGEPGETSLTRLARRWVPNDLRNEWREAHAKGQV